jgi:hypothetical protein
MKTKLAILFCLPLLGLLLIRCGKDDGICVGSTGKIITETRPVSIFNYIEVYDNINLILTQDTNRIEVMVEAGENLIDGITTEITNKRLSIKNQNSCNWLRSFEVPVNVYITYKQLDTLVTHAAGNITGTNAWTNHEIVFIVEEGGGTIDLSLNVFKSYLEVSYGTFALNFKGYSQVTYISDIGYGPLNAEMLDSKFTYIYTGSPNDIFVTASVEITAEILNTGNVYYRGDPTQISTQSSGSGKLIKF